MAAPGQIQLTVVNNLCDSLCVAVDDWCVPVWRRMHATWAQARSAQLTRLKLSPRIVDEKKVQERRELSGTPGVHSTSRRSRG